MAHPKLTTNQVEDIRRLYRSILPNGERCGATQLAREFRVSVPVINKVIDGLHPYERPPVYDVAPLGERALYLSAGG